MRIINLTPHDIKIVDASTVTFNKEIRKNVVDPLFGDPIIVTTIPSSGIASAKITSVMDGAIDGVPVYKKQITGCDALPDADDDTIFIVSALYVSAYRAVNGNTDNLYTIADPVYTTDGRTIVGSLGICPAF